MLEWLYLNPLNENNNSDSDRSDSANYKLYFCPSFRFYPRSCFLPLLPPMEVHGILPFTPFVLDHLSCH